jgi:hypothetical protein
VRLARRQHVDDLDRQRARRIARDGDCDHHGSLASTRLDKHVAALRDAGFVEIGTLWQRGDSRLLCAVRG